MSSKKFHGDAFHWYTTSIQKSQPKTPPKWLDLEWVEDYSVLWDIRYCNDILLLLVDLIKFWLKILKQITKKFWRDLRIIAGLMAGFCLLKMYLKIIGEKSDEKLRFCGMPQECPNLLQCIKYASCRPEKGIWRRSLRLHLVRCLSSESRFLRCDLCRGTGPMLDDDEL